MRRSSPWREALRTFSRTPLLSVLSVASIGFSLFTIGLFGLVALNFRASLRSMAERVEVVAFVLRGTPTEAVTAASQDKLKAIGVKIVTDVDKSGFTAVADPYLDKLAKELGPHAEKVKDLIRAIN